MHPIQNKKIANYIILIFVIASLSGCETFFGTPGKPAKNVRTVSFEHRRDEEIFSASYEVFFDSNSVILNTEALAHVDTIAELIKKSTPTLIAISGYTDSFGDAAYNKALSKKRAVAVSKALKARGVNGSSMRIKAFGENNARILTQDNVKILENRRVVIEIKK